MFPIHLKQHLESTYFFKCLFIYFERERERERQRKRAGEGQGQKERERIPSRFLAVSAEPKVGLDLTNHEIMT